MAGGTYTLLIELADDATVTFGAAGERTMAAGWYAYTGSAIGAGGFGRIDRHSRVASGENDVRHWHVDYLLGRPNATLRDDVRSPALDAECHVARAVAESADPVRGIGATDCGCDAHLAVATEHDVLTRAVHRAHRSGRRDGA